MLQKDNWFSSKNVKHILEWYKSEDIQLPMASALRFGKLKGGTTMGLFVTCAPGKLAWISESN